jgi:hypothetical protein
MALTIKTALGEIDKVARTIQVTDNTGLYDAATNPTGYGAPNPELESLGDFFLRFQRLDGTFVDLPVTPLAISYPAIPSDGAFTLYLRHFNEDSQSGNLIEVGSIFSTLLLEEGMIRLLDQDMEDRFVSRRNRKLYRSLEKGIAHAKLMYEAGSPAEADAIISHLNSITNGR